MIGLLADLLGLGPVGIQALLLLVVQAAALRGRRTLTRTGFTGVWFAFSALAGGAAALRWLLTALLSWEVLPVWPAITTALLAIGLYPALALGLGRLHRLLGEPVRNA